MPNYVEMGIEIIGRTRCTLIRSNQIRDIDLTGISAYEDLMINDHMLNKQYEWFYESIRFLFGRLQERI